MHATLRRSSLLASLTLVAIGPSCRIDEELIVVAGDSRTVAPLAETVDLLDGGLTEWVLFSPAENADRPSIASFADGVLTIDGQPKGYLATRRWYRDYELVFDWRWAGSEAGNSGLLVHATTPLTWFDWPRCLEVQLRSGDAGDFILMGDGVGLWANDEAAPRPGATPAAPDIDRRVAKTVDDLERPVGEWNTMRVVCAGDSIAVWVNGVQVNTARDCTVSEGAIAFQSEGAPIAFQNVRLTPADG